jgi:hypothetical protein
MGGGVAVMGATAVLTMTGATIQNCVAPNGGGIYVDGGVANLTGATISSCDATTGHGVASTFIAVDYNDRGNGYRK